MKNTKKIAIAIPASLAAVIMAGSMAVTTFAATDPSDDASAYSYNTGSQSYQQVMSDNGYSADDEISNPDYSFNTGRTASQGRHGAYVNMPTEENLSDEELAAFFEGNGLGEGAAYADGEYNADMKGSYGFSTGRASYEARHASFED